MRHDLPTAVLTVDDDAIPVLQLQLLGKLNRGHILIWTRSSLNFDKQKQDSAVVRKALGQAYGDKKAHIKAIQQLEQAAALQPNEVEIHQSLIAAHDALGNKDGAVRQQTRKLEEQIGKKGQ